MKNGQRQCGVGIEQKRRLFEMGFKSAHERTSLLFDDAAGGGNAKIGVVVNELALEVFGNVAAAASGSLNGLRLPKQSANKMSVVNVQVQQRTSDDAHVPVILQPGRV